MTVNTVVYVNLLVALLSIWAGMYVNSRFIRPTSLNRMRFKLYELRDKLAVLAMKGEVQELSEEYTTLRDLMNSSLASTKDFQITTFIRMHFEIATNEEIQEHVQSIFSKIQKEEMPQEYREIVLRYFEVNRELYRRKTRLLRWALSPLIASFSYAALVLKTQKKLVEYLERQQDKVSTIENVLNRNEKLILNV